MSTHQIFHDQAAPSLEVGHTGLPPPSGVVDEKAPLPEPEPKDSPPKTKGWSKK